jgi:Cof subfamily protein (haloacid dehalogenase superfamily)
MDTLYVSDLDGTLLRNDATLSEFSRTTLQSLLRDGLRFTVASARSVVSMGVMLKGLKLPLPVVEFNGAFLSDLETGRHEIINRIEPAVVEDVYRLIHEFGCVPFISSFNGSEDCAYYRDIINDGMLWYLNDRLANKDKRWRAIEDLTHSFRDQVVCLTVIGRADVLSEVEIAVRERHGKAVETHLIENPYSPGWYWLTVHDCRATKDQAIRVLAESCGLAGGELVVFGDQSNDIKMFRTADRAVAVANAAEGLKRHATQVIGSNQEDSVVKYIRDDWVKCRGRAVRAS